VRREVVPEADDREVIYREVGQGPHIILTGGKLDLGVIRPDDGKVWAQEVDRQGYPIYQPPAKETTTMSDTERHQEALTTLHEAEAFIRGDDGHQTWVQQIATEREAKDAAYRERDQLVAVLSKIWPSHLTTDPHTEPDDEWHNIVCVHTPAGQATWHIHDSELPLFTHLMEPTVGPRRPECPGWDGHTTEQKYERLASLPTHQRPPE
jgi:hypothetical protein